MGSRQIGERSDFAGCGLDARTGGVPQGVLASSSVSRYRVPIDRPAASLVTPACFPVSDSGEPSDSSRRSDDDLFSQRGDS